MSRDFIVYLEKQPDLLAEMMELLEPYTQFDLSEPEPPVDKEVRFFSWSSGPDAKQWHITYDWVRNNSQWNPPTKEAEQAAERFATMDEGDRCLFIWKPNGSYGYEQAISSSDLYRMLTKGPDLSSKAWFIEFFAHLKELGAEPDVIILDYEGGPVLWNLDDDTKAEQMGYILKDPEALAKLPEIFQSIDPDDIRVNSGALRNELHNQWQRWAKPFIADTMKKLVYDAYFEIYGKEIPFSNYGYQELSFPITLQNGFIKDYSTSEIGYSAPVNYILSREHNWDGKVEEWRNGQRKHPRWGAFIDRINKCRSAANVNGGDHVMPWIAPLGYQHLHDKRNLAPDFLDLELLKHCIAMGCNKFNYWNPGPPTQFPDNTRQRSDIIYAETIAFMKDFPLEEKAGNFEPLDRDADVIDTLGIKTTYEEFEAIGIDPRDFG